jgi:hypothetical protein
MKTMTAWMSHLRAYVYAHLTGDEEDQILTTVYIVEASVLPQSIADSEDHCTEWVQPDQLERFVVTGYNC